MSRLGDWLKVMVEADSRNKTRLAADIGVSTQALNDWISGKVVRVTWDNCNGITKAFHIKDGLVFRLAGYTDLSALDAPISEQTLTPGEQSIVRAARLAGPEQLQTLLGVAELILASANAREEPDAEEESPPGALPGPA